MCLTRYENNDTLSRNAMKIKLIVSCNFLYILKLKLEAPHANFKIFSISRAPGTRTTHKTPIVRSHARTGNPQFIRGMS